MNANQILAACALASAIADFLFLVGVAWRNYPTIDRSGTLKVIYPLCWAIFGSVAYGYWRILAEPESARQIMDTLFQPMVIIFLNTLLVVATLATLHGGKLQAQAAELAVSVQNAAESEKRRLDTEKRWLDERQQFLVVIGHELRTPINLITGYLEMLAGILPALSADEEAVGASSAVCRRGNQRGGAAESHAPHVQRHQQYAQHGPAKFVRRGLPGHPPPRPVHGHPPRPGRCADYDQL
jgi:signal transduction histidine kinase